MSGAPDICPVPRTPSGASHSVMRILRLGPVNPDRMDRQVPFPLKHRQAKPTAANFPTRSPGPATGRQHLLYLSTDGCCHRPANVIASGSGGVIRKKGGKVGNGQGGLPRRPDGSSAVEDGASQGTRSDERSSLALDWRWPLPQITERIVSINSVSGSVPPVPTRSVGPVHDRRAPRLPIVTFA